MGNVRLRQITDDIGHRLSFIPTLYVLGSIVFVQFTLWIDSLLSAKDLPTWLETTVESARSVFGAIAGGLITSITLLLSMMLVAVQLASSQFSPRTLRDWLGNRTLQNAVGFVLGTTVYCLLALRSTRDFGEDETAVIPHVTVLIAVALGVLSLVAVVRTVDHITHSVRVGSVSKRIATETISVIDRVYRRPSDAVPAVGPESGALRDDGSVDIPRTAIALETPTSGWIQQIDDDRLFDALPEDATGYVTAKVGTYATSSSPVMWLAPPPKDLGRYHDAMFDAIAVGESRTMQQDVEFGIIQLTDIAVRALSPGINDPTTACDIIVHLGDVMTALWAHPPMDNTTRRGTRTLVRNRISHAAHLERAFSPIIHYGHDDRQVVTTVRDALVLLRAEVERRRLPADPAPIDALIARVGQLLPAID